MKSTDHFLELKPTDIFINIDSINHSILATSDGPIGASN